MIAIGYCSDCKGDVIARDEGNVDTAPDYCTAIFCDCGDAKRIGSLFTHELAESVAHDGLVRMTIDLKRASLVDGWRIDSRSSIEERRLSKL